MKITVTGSLGHIGRPLTQALVQMGHAVTVISSRPENQADIEALGATAAIGTLEDVDFLTATFAGADAVYCMVPPANFVEPDRVAYYRRLAGHYAQAIRQSGVTRVIHLSSFGAHLPTGTGIIVGAHDAEVILNQLPGTHITHIRPTYFYYNLYSFIGMIKTAGIMTANYGGDDPILLVSPVDIAAAIADEITTPATVSRKVRYVASDERTASEIAHVLGAAVGKPGLQWTVISDQQMQSSLEAHGMPAVLATGLTEMYASHHSGAMADDYYRNKPAAMGKVKLEDFVNDFVAAFQQQ